MLATTLQRNRDQAGARPFDPYRDSKPVAELISVAFRGRLGPDGEIALAEMRRIARLGPLLWWAYWPGTGRSGIAPGYVWTERGDVVGNVSLRRASEWGGFFIGNVAVHPDYRGQGIARTLMEKALEAISTQSGRWVGLDARADNRIARQLYEHLGFREVGRMLYMHSTRIENGSVVTDEKEIEDDGDGLNGGQIVIRVKKSDVDKFASKKLKFEEFAERVEVITF